MRRIILLLLLLASVGFGQTSGCPTGATTYAVPSSYATITLAEAALPANLAGLGNQCIEVQAGTYNESIAISGPTNPSATDRIWLVAAVGSEHKGSFTSGVIITTASGFYVISAQVNWCYLRDIVGIHENAGQAAFNSFGRTNTTYERVMAKTNGVTSNQGFTLNGDGEKAIACVAWNPEATSTGDGFQSNTSGTTNFVNCTSVGFLNSFRRVGGTVNATNCVAQKYAAGGGSDYTGIAVQTNNAASDATAAGTDPLDNQGVSDYAFVDPSNGNFHYQASSGMIGTGLDQSGVFTVDVDLETITTWMRGIDFFVAGGATGSSNGGGRLRRMGLAPNPF